MDGNYIVTLKKAGYSIDLATHMAECDANYFRIRKVMPFMDSRDERILTVVFAGISVPVRFVIKERSKYTSVVLIEPDKDCDVGETGMWEMGSISVRLYHDARTAEVIEIQKQRRFDPVYQYPNRKMRARDEKVQINKYLGEFLASCLSHGITEERMFPPDQFEIARLVHS